MAPTIRGLEHRFLARPSIPFACYRAKRKSFAAYLSEGALNPAFCDIDGLQLSAGTPGSRAGSEKKVLLHGIARASRTAQARGGSTA